jgi:hypothetical protein
MSNDLTRIKIAPEFEDLDYRDGLAEGLPRGFSSLHYKGKVWTLRHHGESYTFTRPDDGTPSLHIDVVILARSRNTSKAYYPNAYDEDTAGPPICTSIDGVNLDPGVPEPQAKTCTVCPHNQWTTLENGRRGKECQDHRRMAVLLDVELSRKMLGAPLTDPVFLKVPPGSFANLIKYSDWLQDRQTPHAAVVTRIGFNPQQAYPQLTFAYRGPLAPNTGIRELLNSPETKRLIGDASVIREVDEEEAASKAKVIKQEKMTGTRSARTPPSPTMETREQQEVIPPKRGRPPGSKNKPKQEIEAGGNSDGSGEDFVAGFGLATEQDEQGVSGEFTRASPEMQKEIDSLMPDDDEQLAKEVERLGGHRRD